MFRPQTHSHFNQPLARNAFPGVCSSMSPTLSWQPVRREPIVHVCLRLSEHRRAKAVWSTSRSASLDGSTQRTFQKSGPTLIWTAQPSLVSPPTERRSQSRPANRLKCSRRKPGLLLCHFLAGLPKMVSRWLLSGHSYHGNNSWSFLNSWGAIAACAYFISTGVWPTPVPSVSSGRTPGYYLFEGWVGWGCHNSLFQKSPSPSIGTNSRLHEPLFLYI